MKSFYEYMRSQKLHDCPGADLYEDLRRDASFPKKEHHYWKIRLYLEKHRACEEAMDTFEEWWGTYAHDEGLCENMTLIDIARRLENMLDVYDDDIGSDASCEIWDIIDALYEAS